MKMPMFFFLLNHKGTIFALTAVSLAVMVVGFLTRRRFFERLYKDGLLVASNQQSDGWFMVNEILLNTLLTLASMLMVHWCLKGYVVLKLSIAIGYLAVILSCFGSFKRAIDGVHHLGTGLLEKKIVAATVVMLLGMFGIQNCILTAGILLFLSKN